jgi:hypothetical protein
VSVIFGKNAAAVSFGGVNRSSSEQPTVARWLAGWQTVKLFEALLAARKGLYRNNPASNTQVRICHSGTEIGRLVVPEALVVAEVLILLNTDTSTLI